jgi:hypothetical protein
MKPASQTPENLHRGLLHVVMQIPRNYQAPDAIISVIALRLIFPRCIFLLYHSEIVGKESRYSMT